MNLLNPALGMDLTDEQKRQMLGMALLAGGAGTMANASQPGMVPFGRGIQAMMGSLGDQQQMALMAQMQGLQRKNIESSMEMRDKEFERQGAQFEQQMGMREREAAARREEAQARLDLQQKELDLLAQQKQTQMEEYTRKKQMEQDRLQSAKRIQTMMANGAPENELARAVMAHTMMYGGSPSSNVSNVLLPSGRPPSQSSMFADLMGGGGAESTPPQAPPEPIKPPQAAPTMEEGLGKAQELNVAAEAAKEVQQQQLKARQFVDATLIPASAGNLGFGMGATSDPEEIKKIIKQAEELWPAMGERERQLTLVHVKRLKEKLK